MDPGLLEFCRTERQREMIQAIIDHGGNVTHASKALGVARGTISSCLVKVRRRAAAAGHAPEANMEHRTPEGFHVKAASTLYDNDGNVKLQWVKTHSDGIDDRESLLESVRTLLDPIKGTGASPEPVEAPSDDRLTVYGWGDMHIGMLSWGLETGADFDLTICQSMYERAVVQAVHVAPKTKEALLILVGDNFHMNDATWQTIKSHHKLDGDGRFEKVVGVGLRLKRFMIETLLTKHELVTVFIILGNHDADLSAVSRQSMAMIFEDNDRVRIDVTPGKFHTYRFGKVFIGSTHGDTVKPDKLPLLMAARYPRDWGDTQHRHWYLGHVHHESKKEFSGCKIETLSTMTGKDAYAHEHGYDSERKTVVDVWHPKKGFRYRHVIGVDDL